MFGFGTIVNCAGIIAGGLIGTLLGNRISGKCADSLKTACGVSVVFIGAAGAIEGMLKPVGDRITSGHAIELTLCLAIGTVIGEAMRIEDRFEEFGEWLKRKTKSDGDSRFINGFVSSSLTVSIGAMGMIGSIQDGALGDWSMLGTKAILDFTIVLTLSSSLGKGCVFSAIPVFIIEGAITACASLLKPVITDKAMSNLSMVGSVMIFCIGANLVWGKRIRAANMIPAAILAIFIAYLPMGASKKL